MANYNLTATLNGLREYDFPAPSAGPFVVKGTLELPSQAPTAAQGAGGGGIGTGAVPGLPQSSQVVVVVKNINATIYTGPAGAKGFECGVNIAAPGDLIKVIMSSSLALDQQPNAVKMTLSIFEGAE